MAATRFLHAENINRTGLAKALFTTRLGGGSTGPWHGLNVGLHVGDQAEHVIANRQLVCEELNVNLNQWVCGEQVHGNRVAVVQEGDIGRGSVSYEDALPGVDALVTNRPGIVLSTFAADCVPILLLDPVNKAIGAVHAGWKGTMSQVAKEAVHAMQERFGSDPAQLLAAIGPAIDACCYEVDERVFVPFVEEYPQAEQFFQANDNQRWQLPLPAVNRHILLEAGLLPEHVARVGGCTACDTETYFSHRAERGKTGRLAGLIVLV
ncbi:peptidoglycan editing factor PgeF [Effusibacillus pohliae]|uniref:peptidoglycan editing factor PgeF n=1 Tax=Effusibacillus pohliae TaxID=232270 RepID=UPI000381BCE2|nr:peptidoglycan editing factor PgeF [Effusibacillus pohliae]